MGGGRRHPWVGGCHCPWAVGLTFVGGGLSFVGGGFSCVGGGARSRGVHVVCGWGADGGSFVGAGLSFVGGVVSCHVSCGHR